MRPSPHSPRRQRKALYTSDSFQRRRRMTVPLSKDLRGRFKTRSIPLRKGDTVRVLSGSFVGREERVAKVDRRGYSVILDNVTLKTGEEKLKPLPIRTSHLVITRLNLSDPWRRRVLRVADEDVSAEERGETPEGEEAEETVPALEAPAAEPEPVPPKSRAKRASPPAEPAESNATGDDDVEEDEP
jgi:large subunit ribosomal protein L24